MGQLAQGAAQELQGPLRTLLGNLRGMRKSIGELEVSAGSIERAARLCGQADPTGAVRALTEVQVRELATELIEVVREALDGGLRIEAIVPRSASWRARSRTPGAHRRERMRRAGHQAEEIPGEIELKTSAHKQVRSSPAQLEQALIQVLRNARQAGGPEPVRVRSYDDGDSVVIEIRDGGSGISAAHLERIFEPFFTSRGGAQGIGLGLTLAWSIVQRAGGRIDVRSAPGMGSTFLIVLPAVETPAPAAASSHRAA